MTRNCLSVLLTDTHTQRERERERERKKEREREREREREKEREREERELKKVNTTPFCCLYQDFLKYKICKLVKIFTFPYSSFVRVETHRVLLHKSLCLPKIIFLPFLSKSLDQSKDQPPFDVTHKKNLCIG